ncbi:hypothetical protein HNV12_20855 [Methanococcoides sp. SA1]|nr:hypothetical protein [Methanococcoides sp. SA1]
MLEKFINENINLFAALGIFLALSGYFSSLSAQLQNEFSSLLDLGIVSSITISILLFVIILKNLIKDPANESGYIVISELSFENVERFLFAIPLCMIILVLFSYILQTYDIEIYLIIILLSYIIAIPIYLEIISMKYLNNHLYIVPILIIVAGSSIHYILGQYEPMGTRIIQPVLSTFVQMSLILVTFTFLVDIKKMAL